MPRVVAQGKLGNPPVDVFTNGEVGTLAVGDCVAISRTANNTVIRAVGDDMLKMPAIGFVQKLVGTKAFIRTDRTLEDMTGIVRGDTYWVSPTVPGAITSTAPTPDDFSDPGMIQVVAQGRSNLGTIYVRVELGSAILVG
jgi:hypothetical protein